MTERLCVRHHSAVGLVDRLEAKRLVARLNSTTDRRQVFVRLTPRAETVLAGLSVMHKAELEKLAPLLKDLLGQLAFRSTR